MLAGGLNGGLLSSLEILVLRGAYGASLRQLPFLPYLALRSLLYLGIILLVLIASNLPVGITRADIAFSLALSLGYNLLLGVNDLLGPGVLFAFVAGRYHHPRREERILLFIDMRASTALAERLGEERFLDFLNQFVTDLSLAIAEAGGEIHKYVGDEVIATWTLAIRTALTLEQLHNGRMRRIGGVGLLQHRRDRQRGETDAEFQPDRHRFVSARGAFAPTRPIDNIIGRSS